MWHLAKRCSRTVTHQHPQHPTTLSPSRTVHRIPTRSPGSEAGAVELGEAVRRPHVLQSYGSWSWNHIRLRRWEVTQDAIFAASWQVALNLQWSLCPGCPQPAMVSPPLTSTGEFPRHILAICMYIYIYIHIYISFMTSHRTTTISL